MKILLLCYTTNYDPGKGTPLAHTYRMLSATTEHILSLPHMSVGSNRIKYPELMMNMDLTGQPRYE